MSERRLSRGKSLLVILGLSALAWAALIATVLALAACVPPAVVTGLQIGGAVVQAVEECERIDCLKDWR